MKLTKAAIVAMAEPTGRVTTQTVVAKFGVTRQYASSFLTALVRDGVLIKLGSTRSAQYVSPRYLRAHPELAPVRYTKSLTNVGIEEHVVLEGIERAFPALRQLADNVRSIFTYAFSEMLNNAIEHSKSKTIRLEVAVTNKRLSFAVADSGIGVFRNIMERRKLANELEAIQDLLKGKTTTLPKSHSGEGIFFTSKVGDLFVLDSYGYQLIVNNELPDVFVQPVKRIIRGTRVSFQLNTSSELHLNDVFSKFANLDAKSDYGFDKTEIQVKLYTITGVHISRSQARRVLTGLEKFRAILFDFDKVPTVGQAFADEIFRVFHHRHPSIKLQTANMNAGVTFMIKRAESEVAAQRDS